MADPELVELIRKGVSGWNRWRSENKSVVPDLREALLIKADLRGALLDRAHLREALLIKANLIKADLRGAVLDGADLREAHLDGADLREAHLHGANLIKADLNGANLIKADLSGANLTKADLNGANLNEASLNEAHLTKAYLDGADLRGAYLGGADLSGALLDRADLRGALLDRADLRGAHLSGADLSGALLIRANLMKTDLSGADLTRAHLSGSTLVETNLEGAILTAAKVYGISVWDVKLQNAVQTSLVITPKEQPEITVDDLEVAQFIYLLLARSKLRDVIITLGEKAVLVLGRFTERKELLESIAIKLRDLKYLPIIFDFDRPTDRDLTETVKVLAGLSRFVIADITNPRSVPLELQATVPDYMVPFVTMLERGQPAFGMFDDLPRKYHWALPLLEYNNAETLLAAFEEKVIDPALEKLKEVRRQKASLPARRSAEG